MKRINLSVDLEDNKLFDESITTAVESYAKQVARKAIQEELESEINRLVKLNAEAWASSYTASEVRGRICNEVNQEARKVVENAKITASDLELAVDRKLDILVNSIDVDALIAREVQRILPRKLFEVLSGIVTEDSQ